MEFRWNEWNQDHIAQHGISIHEAEFIIRNARRPFPDMIGDGKYYVMGQTIGGDYIQVIYVLDDPTTAYVIHARPLNDTEKRRFRRRRT